MVQQPLQIPVDDAVTEERIEYRDENGNLLDESQVKELEGKVSFSTRYETRTRIVDPQGNEIDDYAGVVDGEGAGVAGTLAEGRNPDTQNPVGEAEANTKPAQVPVASDVAKEQKIAGGDVQGGPGKQAEPEGEAGKATAEVKDEL